MSMPDNLEMEWYSNGKIREIYEFDERGEMHGLHIAWDPDTGKLSEYAEYVNGLKHGKYLSWYSAGYPFVSTTFNNGEAYGIYMLWLAQGTVPLISVIMNSIDITKQIKGIVSDIHNITDTEKTQIALQFGLVL